MSNKIWERLFLGFIVLVILSGIFFIIEKNYLQGVCGISVGALLLYQNMKQKENQSQDKE